jgi:pimeloyl-ACP methyl ester carboxylesterase/DNA-binding SARP family transcriptional activator
MFGEGPPVVAVPPLAQNIELAWERPEIAGMLTRFGSFSRYVHFDKRGTGASDRSAGLADLDERVEDMLAIFDAAEIEQAHLYAVSDGGPMAILLAVTHPDRVSSVVLDSTAACLVPDDHDPARRMLWDAFAEAWGTDSSMTLDIMAPTLAADPEYRRWQPRYERQSATPSALRDLLSMIAAADVRSILGDLRVPTLQLHRTGDHVVSLDLARATAAKIENCRLVEFPGSDHFSFASDIDPWMDEIEAFITGRAARSVAAAPASAAAVEQDIAPPTSSTRIRTFGRFGVERDGVAVPVAEWGSRRARQLCKRLIVADGQAVPRSQLIELLWPGDQSPDRLGPRLSVVLSAVRRVLGGGVSADRDSVRIDSTAHDIDLTRFRAARDRGDDRGVIALYEGEFLADDVYEDWTAPMRDECRHATLSAIGRLLDAERDPAAALELADRALKIDPYHEAAHRRRIGSLVLRGDRGAAREAYARYRGSMAEIGVAVEPFDVVASDPTPR